MSAILLLKSMNARSPLAISTQMQFVISWENPIELMSAISWWTSMTFNPMAISVVHVATHGIGMDGHLLHQSMGLAQWQQLGHTRYYFAIFAGCHQLLDFFFDIVGKWHVPGYATTPWDQKRSWALTLQSGSHATANQQALKRSSPPSPTGPSPEAKQFHNMFAEVLSFYEGLNSQVDCRGFATIKVKPTLHGNLLFYLLARSSSLSSKTLIHPLSMTRLVNWKTWYRKNIRLKVYNPVIHTSHRVYMSKLKHTTPTTKKQWKRQFRNTMKHMLLVVFDLPWFMHQTCFFRIPNQIDEGTRPWCPCRNIQKKQNRKETSDGWYIFRFTSVYTRVPFRPWISFHQPSHSATNCRACVCRLPIHQHSGGFRACTVIVFWGRWGTCLLYVKTLNQKN